MRILAIDYGTKNIGLALSDESFTISRESGVLSPKDFWLRIQSFVLENDVGKVFVGLPLGLQGQDTDSTKRARLFIKKLEELLEMEIETIDERFTTDLARRMAGNGSHHDSLVAQIMLQEYLNRSVSGF